MGLTALMLLQHARSPARFDEEGAIVLLEQQDRGKWDREMIAEGHTLVREGAAASVSWAVPVAGRDRRRARAWGAGRGDRLGRDRRDLRRAGADAALAGGDAQSCGGGG